MREGDFLRLAMEEDAEVESATEEASPSSGSRSSAHWVPRPLNPHRMRASRPNFTNGTIKKRRGWRSVRQSCGQCIPAPRGRSPEGECQMAPPICAKRPPWARAQMQHRVKNHLPPIGHTPSWIPARASDPGSPAYYAPIATVIYSVALIAKSGPIPGPTSLLRTWEALNHLDFVCLHRPLGNPPSNNPHPALKSAIVATVNY